MLLMLGVVWTEPGGDERMEGWWEARSTRPMTMGGRWTGLARRSGVDWLGSGWQTGRQTGGGAGAHHRPCRQDQAEMAVWQQTEARRATLTQWRSSARGRGESRVEFVGFSVQPWPFLSGHAVRRPPALSLSLFSPSRSLTRSSRLLRRVCRTDDWTTPSWECDL